MKVMFMRRPSRKEFALNVLRPKELVGVCAQRIYLEAIQSHMGAGLKPLAFKLEGEGFQKSWIGNCPKENAARQDRTKFNPAFQA